LFGEAVIKRCETVLLLGSSFKPRPSNGAFAIALILEGVAGASPIDFFL